MGKVDQELEALRAEAETEQARVQLAELRARALAAEERTLLRKKRLDALSNGEKSVRRRSAISIAGAASLIAAALPVATFVHGWVQKDRDLALEREKQLETARMAYLDRLKDVDSRERVLRFIRQTSNDSKMRDWATEEQRLVGATQTAILDEIKALAAKVNSNQDHEAVKVAEDRIAELEARLGKPSGVAVNRPSSGTSPSARISIAPPPSPDASLPSSPPAAARGSVPTVASECTQWSPPADLQVGGCKIACWDSGQRTKYNVSETRASASLAECSGMALGRCQKAQNSFCAFAWAPSSAPSSLAGKAVSCSGTTQSTLAKLSASAQGDANKLCSTLTKVVTKSDSKPYLWPDGTGLSFDTGHQIDGQPVWCSCFLSNG